MEHRHWQAATEIPKSIGTSPDSAATLPGKERSPSITTSNAVPAPEIKTANLEKSREPTVGTSDLKKP